MLLIKKVEEVAAAAFAVPMPSTGDKEICYDVDTVTTLATFSFDDMIQAVEDVMRKPLSIQFKLHVSCC